MNHSAITELDDLIVGGGITGSLIAFVLQQKGRVVGLMDSGQKKSSSAIAAGIMNPVTGKNFVKSWNTDLFFPIAVDMYRNVEKKLGVRILEKMNIIRHLSGPGAENQWESRLLDDNYKDYVSGTTDLTEWKEELSLQGKYAEIQNAYRADLLACMQAIADDLSSRSLFWNQTFDHDLLTRQEEKWTYPGIICKNVIFCEGYKGTDNPLFPDRPFALTLGTASVISVPGSKVNKMVKDEIFLVPLGKDEFWLGGGYSAWHHGSAEVTTNPDVQTKNADGWILRPHTLLTEKSAVRPTTKSRRPLISKHPNLPNLYFVNGMGTKGTSMAPYFVSLLADILNGEKPEEDWVLPGV